MCRLFGIAYNHTAEAIDTAAIAAHLFGHLTNGGPHSFGWFVSDEMTVHTEKHYGRADTPQAIDSILDFRGDDEIIEDEIRFFVGHTRWATQGRPEHMPNNHPITHKNIIGVHNGKVYNPDKVLSVTGREDTTATVDSEAIFAAVNRWGPVKGLSKLSTDMVSVFTDLRAAHRLTLARTSNRPVVIGWTERGNIIFASERQALEGLWPLVRFIHFSTVKENRILTIENGEIATRRDFYPKKVESKGKSKKPSSIVLRSSTFEDVPSAKWTEDDEKFLKYLEEQDARAKAREDRASKRGEAMFPRRLP